LLGFKAALTQGTDAEKVSGAKNPEAILDLIMSGKARPFWAACAKLQYMGATADDKDGIGDTKLDRLLHRPQECFWSASLPYLCVE